MVAESSVLDQRRHLRQVVQQGQEARAVREHERQRPRGVREELAFWRTSTGF
jgi:hypothetical protein